MGTGVARVQVPLVGLLEKAARTAAQMTTIKTIALRVKRKQPSMVAGGHVVVVCQRVVRRMVLLARLRAVVG